MEKELIFVVDHDLFYTERLKSLILLDPNFAFESFQSWQSLSENLIRNPSIIFLAYQLSDISYQDALNAISSYNSDISVIILLNAADSSEASVLTRRESIGLLIKDQSLKYYYPQVVSFVRIANKLRKENSVFREKSSEPYKANRYLQGNSDLTVLANRQISKAAANTFPVLLNAEMGFDLEETARYIHYNSALSKTPFESINLKQLTPAATKSVLIQMARSISGGEKEEISESGPSSINATLMLRHIEKLDSLHQEMLLDALSSKKTEHHNNEVFPRARYIFSTEENLELWCAKKKFHPGLYDVIMRYQIAIPPLSSISEDIPFIARHYLTELADAEKSATKEITIAAMEKLSSYPYPGNLAELKSILSRAYHLSGPIIDATQISFSETPMLPDFSDWNTTLDEYNRYITKIYLKKYNNDVVGVAKILNIGKSTLYRNLDRWMIKIKTKE